MADPTYPLISTRQDMLARLGIERLVLSIHQASFPASADDIGHGAPASRRGRDLLAWARGLGFTGIALGPAGITTRENPSPYDATIFSRNPLHVAFGAFGADVHAPAQRDHVDYAHAWDEAHRLLRGIEVSDDELALRREAMPWLAIEARYEGIAAIHGDDWRAWPLSPSEDAAAARAFEVGQLLADRDHAAFVAAAREHGLAVYADLPIGISHRDRWSLQDSFLPGYAMGAPPSRTNPDGQPWDFPVLDPRRDVSALIAARLDRALDGCAGLRIDHPHGWVCPWVYQRGGDVKLGARLYESPDLADHPALAAYARVRPDQIDRSRARHDDDWVRALEPAQVDAYAAIFDRLVARVGANDLMVEVLSTCPRPLAAVLARFGLGRFRITQKARVSVADDVYRSDNAQPADWIMVGNHDTPSLRAVIASWSADERERRARYLGARLRRPLRDDDRELATAMLADLFLGPARNVIIFWPDLFAIEEPFNRPGVISADNWRLRMPPDFERPRPPDVAPDLGTALTWAIAAR